jgi:hypothetical protein
MPTNVTSLAEVSKSTVPVAPVVTMDVRVKVLEYVNGEAGVAPSEVTLEVRT